MIKDKVVIITGGQPPRADPVGMLVDGGTGCHRD
jgi:hypothetical protein